MSADLARINELYQKLSASPLGMATPWERKANAGKPLLYGGKRGLLANGTIATWDEFDLIVAVVNGLPSILSDLECWFIVEQLRAPEGAEVILLCDNPEFNGLPNNAIEIVDDWTQWTKRRFTGDTVLDCLRAALRARTEDAAVKAQERRDEGR